MQENIWSLVPFLELKRYEKHFNELSWPNCTVHERAVWLCLKRLGHQTIRNDMNLLKITQHTTAQLLFNKTQNWIWKQEFELQVFDLISHLLPCKHLLNYSQKQEFQLHDKISSFLELLLLFGMFTCSKSKNFNYRL